MEDQRDDPRLGTLAPPRQLLAPLENRAQRGRDREGPAFLVLLVPGSSRTKPPFQSIWNQVSVNTSGSKGFLQPAST